MMNIDEKRKATNRKWADRIGMVLLMCLLAVLIVTSIHMCDAYGAESKSNIKLVLQLDSSDGGILKGLVVHYLSSNHSIEVREAAKYTVILLGFKKSIYQGLISGAQSFIFTSILVLEQKTDQIHVLSSFANVYGWGSDINKKKAGEEVADAIATIISGLSKGDKEIP